MAAWCEAIQRNRALEEQRDVPRIREAFGVLLTRSRRWPAPVEFLEAIPRYVPELLPALPVSAEEAAKREAARLRVKAEVDALFGIDP